jgi:hypothetical protein
VPETSFARVGKDSAAERGKRLCGRGTIISITADHSSEGTAYMGQFMMQGQKVLDYIAVGSTGDLVARNSARFCGIVTGTSSYSNSGGGQTHAVRVVGMFELEENTGRRPSRGY